MNPDLDKLQPYPFERLARLKAGIEPPVKKHHIALSIGEPKHQTPKFVLDKLANSLNGVSRYPATAGLPELRITIANWLTKRFQLAADSLDPLTQVVPVNGTREALFAFAQATVDRSKNPVVAMPNPFYQIYEGAALLSGAEPYFMNCTEDSRLLPDLESVPNNIWQRCQLVYICTPGNPTGAVASIDELKKLIALADQYNFIIASDECYSEIYMDESNPPAGILQACTELGRFDYKRCVTFQSLSKRSNLPGLRSGFVAGDQEIIQQFLLYRTYHGGAMAEPCQQASIAAWNDEQHVIENRRLYREKFAAVTEILKRKTKVITPNASFFLWIKTPINEQEFSQQLFAQQNITVLPGTYLARDTANGNPAQNYVRVALVAPISECVEAAHRIADFFDQF